MEIQPDKSIAALFTKAIAIEHQAAQLYMRFAKLFAHIPEMVIFWQGLAREEGGHAATLVEIRQSLSGEQLLAVCDTLMWQNIVDIKNMLDHTVAEPVLTLQEAYELANEFEFSEVNAVFQFLAISFVSSGDREKFVSAEIAQHQSKLINFSSDFGDKKWRQQVLALPQDGR